MSGISPIGPVTSGTAPVYAALSPYLNGARRTSTAAAAVQAEASAASASAAATAAAVAARSEAEVTVIAAPPFLNPAITTIATQTALGEVLTPPVAVTPNAQPATPVAPPATTPADAFYGDSGLLVQSYGAVALLTGPQAAAGIYGLAAAPAVAPVAPVLGGPRVARLETSA